jgi:hypothetical protein
MAVTITRSVWIDDDGTGTTGTVINQALHTTLYNEIDTALAKVAQLAGGNAFTGNQAITGGNLTVAGAGPHTFSTASVLRLQILAAGEVVVNSPAIVGGAQFGVATDGATHNGIGLTNLNTNNAMNFMVFTNSAGGIAGTIGQTGATSVNYGTTSDLRLKTDHGRATDLSALRAVVVHDFTWTADGMSARGVFAQEVHPVFPRAITAGTDETTADGHLARPWMTDYSKFVPDLIVGWQQHAAELADLRARLAMITG